MRITKQPSRGRGEYEISEISPDGLKPHDLISVPIYLSMGNYSFATGVKVMNQGGKNRLRIEKNQPVQHIHIQVAGVLLMPHPIRDESRLPAGEPVLQDNSYLIKNIHFGAVECKSDKSFCIANVLTIDCKNQSHDHIVVAQQRLAAIEKIWAHKRNLPNDMKALIEEHEGYVKGGTPIPKRANDIVELLQIRMAKISDELVAACTRTTDVLPALLEFLDIPMERAPLIAIEQIDAEAVELKKREINRWRWQANRGYQGMKFRNEVREAYRSRCLMCGSAFPATESNHNPGIDAAHILPWSDVDLDKVYNGIALCKLHHWAFDEGILRISYRDSRYFIEIPSDVEQTLMGSNFSLDVLRNVVGEIPQNRLPDSRQDWPRPELLKRLYDAF